MIHLSNGSSQNVLVKINSEESCVIGSHEKQTFELSGNQITVSLRPTHPSRYQKGAAHIGIETNYRIEDVSEGETLEITREKIRFCEEAYYDRFFLAGKDGMAAASGFSAVDTDALKRGFRRRQITDILFWGPFEAMDIPTFLLLLSAPILIYFLGWKLAFGILAFLWILMIAAGWIGRKILAKVFPKLAKEGWDQKDFAYYCSSEGIRDYYALPDREPFAGEIYE